MSRNNPWTRRSLKVAIDEYYEAKKAYLSSLVKYSEQIPETHELQTTSRMVATGSKL